MDDKNRPTRRSMLSSLGKTASVTGVASMIGAQKVAAREGTAANAEEIIQTPEVQNVFNALEEYLNSDSTKHDWSDTKSGRSHQSRKGVSSRVKLHYSGTDIYEIEDEKGNQALTFTVIPTSHGKICHIEIDELSRAVFFPWSDSINVGASDRRRSHGWSGANDVQTSKRSNVWFEANSNRSLALRSLTDTERSRISPLIKEDNFGGFTYSEANKLFVTTEEGVPDDKVKVYTLNGGVVNPVKATATDISVIEGSLYPKGGISANNITAQDKWCGKKKGYCAFQGYACLQELAICGICMKVSCSVSSVAWPAVLVCLGCFVSFCGTAALPQIGSCTTTVACVEDYLEAGGTDVPDSLENLIDTWSNPLNAPDICD